jgi:hypothetical protein
MPVPLPPWQIRRDQLGNIGTDGEVLRGIACRADTEDDGQQDDGTCMPDTEGDSFAQLM